MRYLLSVMLFFCLMMMAYADALSSLTLTDAEMQKLKNYFPEEDTNRLTWKGDPLSISLAVNQEKRLVFPSSVSVDVKGALTADQLRILNNDKSVYLTALKSFAMTRIYVTLKETNQVIFLDLMTNEENEKNAKNENASNATEQIDIQQNNNRNNPTHATASTINETIHPITEENSVNDTMNFADCIRFTWQKMYAPERLIQNTGAFARAPMHIAKTEKFISGLVYGDKVIAYPESAWGSGNYYVTAILLRNKYPHKTTIDISKDLCGAWLAASLYPTNHLKPYGNKLGDSAMLFLISNRPFGDVIGVCNGNA